MVAQLGKSIRPGKLKSKSVRAKILNALKAEGKVVKAELEKTTRTWKGAKPTFQVEIGYRRGDVILLIGPGGDKKGAEKWGYLNYGTKPHSIQAKNAPMLVFRGGSGFKPKTKVGTFNSGPGANTGPWMSKFKVQHPGIEARDWTGMIERQRKKKFTAAMVKAARME